MSAAADVFLSYNREDAATARRVADAFEREGLSVWWDATLRSGEAYDEVTERALRDAKAVVVLWSKRSVTSRWVRAEATLADRKGTLVPAMIEPCERPIMFELTQTADLSAWNGDPRERTWLAFVADVRRFLGVPSVPSAERIEPSVPTQPQALDPRPSLAILPFTNRSGEASDEVFAEGMVEDLNAALSLSGTIRVIAQSATAGYRRTASDLRTMGRELGVRYVLEGNVRRAAAQLRVTAQLVEIEQGAILWTQKFERPLSELAELQEALVTEVAGHLGVQLERIETERALRKPGDLTAWEAMTRADAQIGTLVPEAVQAGVVEARRAVAVEPDYAPARALLAACLAVQWSNHRGSLEESVVGEIRGHAERALALDARDPFVLGMVAVAFAQCRSWREAYLHAKRAVEINPYFHRNRFILAQICVHQDLPDEALEHLRVHATLAPRGPLYYLNTAFRGLALLHQERHAEALEALEESIRLRQGFVFALKDKAYCLEKLGRHEEALEAIAELRRSNPDVPYDALRIANDSGNIAPRVAADMNRVLRELWDARAPERRA